MISSLCMAQEVLRPTVESNGGKITAFGCAGVNQASSPMPLAYDNAGLATNSEMVQQGNSSNGQLYYKTRLFTTWGKAGGIYPSLTLNVNLSGSVSDPLKGDGKSCIGYSTNSGATWAQIVCDDPIPRQTFTITLSPSQNLGNLIVGACAEFQQTNLGTPAGSERLFIWDIWTSGAASPPAPGTGSNLGLAVRGIVGIN